MEDAMDRLTPAQKEARLYLVRELPTGSAREGQRAVCQRIVTWVFLGGSPDWPAVEITRSIRTTVEQAVKAGIDRAYGEAFLHEVAPGTYNRLNCFGR
jgi:hypothetical protein